MLCRKKRKLFVFVSVVYITPDLTACSISSSSSVFDLNQTNLMFPPFALMLTKEAIKCLNAAIDIYTDMVRRVWNVF